MGLTQSPGTVSELRSIVGHPAGDTENGVVGGGGGGCWGETLKHLVTRCARSVLCES